MSSTISVRGLTKYYGRSRIEDLDVDVEAGEVFGQQSSAARACCF